METKQKVKELDHVLHEILEQVHPEQSVQALNLLEKIATNICNNPAEQKFKTIKTTNKALSQKLFNVDPLFHDAVKLLGFEFDLANDQYTLPDSKIGILLGEINTIRDYRDMAHAQNTGDEKELEKCKTLRKERIELEKQQRELRLDQLKIQEQLEADQKERKYMKKGVGSKANQLKFGANIKTAEQCGIKVSKGG
ncbi:hypothetical protein PPERSA_02444 [Pseudocohnilembus persalinus]|uniref:PUB domain-containing protein n=1 Tax=Pseudocohnilembus persalinus TaxID=266149 RepID=A0A0V0QB94_PSEPJ|nr:hypothetical protein PPERSA_02444 [Pseudocohnilembus persalinus]|eukprot:KRW99332.1 hypothetical protein PPERSA_02444 [Pseudocohnilembus persalinus]